ncbi:hypothetical protein Q8F55_004713 [Vanrija albida]|uniref:Amino acid transporter transmembrane domain-containing protein n=1 Tax=Vanrija albida TaxID=181172 RepID=A0ABR3PZL4_9TREE
MEEAWPQAHLLPSLNFANVPLQLAANAIGLVCTGLAGVLYANVGVKVFYQNVLREYFGAPTLATRRGSVIWSITMALYWALAWVVGSAVPNLNALVTLIGAACILQFTYTFPPILLLGFWVQKDAIAGDLPWQPGQPAWSNRVDTWRDLSRWKRGFRPYWYAKLGLVVLFIAALSLAGLGIYAGVQIATDAFETKSTASFSCRAPGQP